MRSAGPRYSRAQRRALQPLERDNHSCESETGYHERDPDSCAGQSSPFDRTPYKSCHSEQRVGCEMYGDYRVRQGFVKGRTAQANQIRGLLGEFGLIIPQGISDITERVPTLPEDASNELPAAFRQLIEHFTAHLKELDRQAKEFERQIIAWHRSSELSRKLEKIPGIGPLVASALVASIADANSFDNGRQVSAWLGLVLRQCSSGGKSTLLGMSKRGDAYLRTLLIDGARSRSAILAAQRKSKNTNVWLTNLLNRRHPNVPLPSQDPASIGVARQSESAEKFHRIYRWLGTDLY